MRRYPINVKTFVMSTETKTVVQKIKPEQQCAKHLISKTEIVVYILRIGIFTGVNQLEDNFALGSAFKRSRQHTPQVSVPPPGKSTKWTRRS